MRRSLPIVMLLLLSLPLLAPVLAQSTHAGLLLCCRKGGLHHCTTSVPSDGALLQAHCPVCCTSSTPVSTTAWMVGSDIMSAESFIMEELRISQIEAGYRISFHRSRQKRGPPAKHIS